VPAGPALSVRGLTVRYGRPGKTPPAVDDVSFDVAPGETLGLVGESGSGKSTIGKAILGLVPATAGQVLLHGADITRASLRRRRVAAVDLRVVFQDPYSSLNPAQTIGQTLVEPLRVLRVPKDQWRAKAAGALAAVGLPADAADRYPARFSGGQRQRIAIARALVCDPRVIVLDEPVSALDLSTQAQVLNLLADLRDSRQLALLFIAHDLGVVRFLAQRVVVLYRGQVLEAGGVEEVTQQPRHPYTIALTAAAPVPQPAEQARRRTAREALGIGTAGVAPPAAAGCPFAARCPLATDVCRTTRPPLTSGVACHHADEAAALRFPAAAGHPRSLSDSFSLSFWRSPCSGSPTASCGAWQAPATRTRAATP
jgi:peptide/nickel transport system ATP-binding protein